MGEVAYVFWHVPGPGVDEEVYVAGLEQFHLALVDANIPGFHGSTTWGLPEPSWLPRPWVYEDWYVLEGFAVIEDLNVAAVSGSREACHDELATAVDESTGGLYGLRWGELIVSSACSSHWFARPAGRGSGAFIQSIVAPLDPVNSCLWQRQLALGPAPEFCLLLGEDPPLLDLPEGTISFSL